MNAKKVLAMILATSMVVGSSMTVLAEDKGSSATGTGEMEGYVATDVFSVVIPTVAEDTFDFIMDPQGLISATEGERYSGATFDDGTVFFATEVVYSSADDGTYAAVADLGSYYDADGNSYADYEDTTGYVLLTAVYSDTVGTVVETYTGTKYTPTTSYTSNSAVLEVTNKSSVDVAITVDATLSDYGDVVITGDSTFKDDTDASLYLALVDTETTPNTATFVDENSNVITAELTSTIDKVTTTTEGSTGFKVVYDSDKDEYSYELDTSDTNLTYGTYSFYLTGAANSEGDWSAINEAETQPNVEVVWTVTDPTVTESAALECDLQLSAGGSITSSMTITAGVFISVDGSRLSPTAASELTSITLNGSEIISSSTVGLQTSTGDLYFKFPSSTTLSAGDVITVTVSGVTYTYTLAS